MNTTEHNLNTTEHNVNTTEHNVKSTEKNEYQKTAMVFHSVVHFLKSSTTVEVWK